MRARVNSVLLFAVPVARMIGGALSGWIMAHMQDTMGLRGWQSLSLIEGLPAIALGLVAPLILNDRPEQAAWLSGPKRQALRRDLWGDGRGVRRQCAHQFRLAMRFYPGQRMLGRRGRRDGASGTRDSV